MKNITDQLIANNTHCYFISPAFGDAASSTGELLSYLSGKVDLTIINIFTKPGEGKLTFSTKRFLKKSGNENPETLYTLIKQEDANALGIINATIQNAEFADAVWRKKPHTSFSGKYIAELHYLYPTFSHIVSGNIVKEDKITHKALVTFFSTITQNTTNNFKVFCPVGFFKHVDYLLVRDACWETFGENCIFYSLPVEDILDQEKNTFLSSHALTPVEFTFSSETKVKLLKAYESQSNHFFNDDSIVFRPEIYYVPANMEKKEVLVKEYTELDPQLLHDWQHLWNISEYKNFFNSPSWFKASLKTFNYKTLLIITCYYNEKLIGILPLVLAEKYGISAYVSPGNQYYDNSSLLLHTTDTQVVSLLIKKVSEHGNFYLSEVGQTIATIASASIPGVKITKSSICPYIILEPDPYRFLSKKSKSSIAKRFKDAQDNLSYKIYGENGEQQLRTLLSIDAESSKKADFKETFSDPLLTKLLANINVLDTKALVVAILFHKNEPICYNYGFVYEKTYIGSGTAFKQAWRSLAPGKVLAYLLLPELMKMGITMLDFSRGYSRYKRDFVPYAYHQYALFHSSNPLVMAQWRALNFVKEFLEQHYSLYEITRKIKKVIFK